MFGHIPFVAGSNLNASESILLSVCQRYYLLSLPPPPHLIHMYALRSLTHFHLYRRGNVAEVYEPFYVLGLWLY
jgi:hypothetical protein